MVERTGESNEKEIETTASETSEKDFVMFKKTTDMIIEEASKKVTDQKELMV